MAKNKNKKIERLRETLDHAAKIVPGGEQGLTTERAKNLQWITALGALMDFTRPYVEEDQLSPIRSLVLTLIDQERAQGEEIPPKVSMERAIVMGMAAAGLDAAKREGVKLRDAANQFAKIIRPDNIKKCQSEIMTYRSNLRKKDSRITGLATQIYWMMEGDSDLSLQEVKDRLSSINLPGG